ncbi:MAG: peptide deformylase [Bacteroidia bacterium]|nr:peptide deformylase [Bacteroidia bacterium]
MILPIAAYGNPVLRKVAADITPDYPGLAELIENMFETMHKADGVGLAAPQVNLSIRLFVVDGSPLKDTDPLLEGYKRTFINARIIERFGDEWAYNEGCLSVPGIREDIMRPAKIKIKYFDEKFNAMEDIFDGMRARIIQHEYDHIEGILFPDRVNPFKRRLIKGKLTDIAKGKVDIHYKMNFPVKKSVIF